MFQSTVATELIDCRELSTVSVVSDNRLVLAFFADFSANLASGTNERFLITIIWMV